jgi:hypothetical protein
MLSSTRGCRTRRHQRDGRAAGSEAWFGPDGGGGGGSSGERRRVVAGVARARGRTRVALQRGDRVITSMRRDAGAARRAAREADVAAFLDGPSPGKKDEAAGTKKPLMSFPGF